MQTISQAVGPTYESQVLMELPGLKGYLGIFSKQELIDMLIDTDIIIEYISEYINTYPINLNNLAINFENRCENSEKVETFFKTNIYPSITPYFSNTQEGYDAFEAHIKYKLEQVSEEQLLEFYSDIESMENLNNLIFQNIEKSPLYDRIPSIHDVKDVEEATKQLIKEIL